MTRAHGYSRYQVGCRCDICKQGSREYMRAYRKREDKRARELMRNEAAMKALQRLRRYHPVDYRAFYETELYELEREARTR